MGGSQDWGEKGTGQRQLSRLGIFYCLICTIGILAVLLLAYHYECRVSGAKVFMALVAPTAPTSHPDIGARRPSSVQEPNLMSPSSLRKTRRRSSLQEPNVMSPSSLRKTRRRSSLQEPNAIPPRSLRKTRRRSSLQEPNVISPSALRKTRRRSSANTLSQEQVGVSEHGNLLKSKLVGKRSINTTAMHDINKFCAIFNNQSQFDPKRFVVARDHRWEGTREHPSWAYLKTPCMQKRYDMAADRMAKAHCRRVLEVGGYTSPVVGNSHFKRGDLYVNVDPSISQADGSVEGGFAQLAVPATLQEFVAVVTGGNDSITPSSLFLEPFDCVLLLGAWHMQFETDGDRSAFAAVTRNARMVILESPQSVDFQGLTIGAPILKGNGFNCAESPVVDCSMDPKSVSLKTCCHFQQLVRHMEVFLAHGATFGTPYCKHYSCD